MKKAAEERRQNQVAPVQSKSSEPRLVLPHLARIETKVYKPGVPRVSYTQLKSLTNAN